jgi:hypothetical protein
MKKRQKNKAQDFLSISESMGILGSEAADKPVQEILESFVKYANGNKKLAYDRVQEFLEKLSHNVDPEYTSKLRRVKLRLEQDM